MTSSPEDVWMREMAQSGWSQAWVSNEFSPSMTRPMAEGLVAACSVRFASGDSKTTVRHAVVGVGHTPSTRLMPRLTLRPEVMLMGDPLVDRNGGDPPEAARASTPSLPLEDLASAVNTAANEVAHRFVALADLEWVLRSGYSVEVTEPHTNLLVFLAATHRSSAAVELAHAMQSDMTNPDEEFDRFVRQLELWVAAGASEAPALEDWPPEYFQDRVSESPESIRQRERLEKPLRKAAVDAARPYARTDSLPELVARLERELADRGLRESRATTTMLAQLLRTNRRGRAKAGFTLLKTGLTQYKDSVNALRSVFGDTDTAPFDSPTVPEWALPPAHAAFTPPVMDHQDLTIDLTPEAGPTIKRLIDHPPNRRPMISVDLWFDIVEHTREVGVFIGNQRIGSLSGDDATTMGPVFEAASRFQELPRLPGILQVFDPPLGTSLTAHRPAPFPPLPSF